MKERDEIMNYDWNLLVSNLKDRKIIIFGAGNAGRELADILSYKGFKVDGFIDNDRKKQGTKVGNIEVTAPGKAAYAAAYIVAVENNDVCSQLVKQLLQLDINEKDIFVFNRSVYLDYLRSAGKREIEFCLNKMCCDVFGEDFDMYHPRTYNEIINWEKTNVHDERRTRLTDKVLVRDWVEKKIGKEYLNRVYAVFDNENEIDFRKLPKQYVLKLNNGSGRNIIVKDSSSVNEKEIVEKLRLWRTDNFAFHSFEMHYRDIVPKIICEEYMEGIAEELYDYNIYCFHGEPEYIWCIKGSHREGCQATFYDREWKRQEFSYGYPLDPITAPRPERLEKMLELSRVLAKEFEHVRVDWYVLASGDIRFGEMSFSSWSGLCKFEPEKYDRLLGDLVKKAAHGM